MSTATIDIEGIGPVRLERSQRARRVSISVRPFRGVRVAVPRGLSFKKAAEFAVQKADWIRQQLDRMRRYEQKVQAQAAYAAPIDPKQAGRELTGRLRRLAQKHGYSYNRVFICNQRTRWGSCSSRNNISLNVQLVKLPDELIDYVILHELVHTRHKDHGRAFWAELDGLVGNGRKLARRIREYGIGLK